MEDGLEDILDTVLNVKPGYPPYDVRAIQLRDEISELARLVKENDPETVLEIGTARGGTFYIWCRYLKKVHKLASLDLPGGDFGGGYREEKVDIFREFSDQKDLYFVRADSGDSETFDEVSTIFDDGIDFLFIDADHTYEGVKRDFEMYSPLVNDGGIVALHDIVPYPDGPEEVRRRRAEVNDIEERHLFWDESSIDCNVNQFWAEIRDDHRTTEIVSHPEQTHSGIGVVHL